MCVWSHEAPGFEKQCDTCHGQIQGAAELRGQCFAASLRGFGDHSKMQPPAFGLLSGMAPMTYIFGHVAGALVMRAWEWI